MSPLFRIPAIFQETPNLLAAESTRHGGVSPAPYTSLNLGLATADAPENVAENRARFWRALGTEANKVASSHQVHGSEVLLINEPGHHEGYDALITNKPGIVLTVTVADCTPVLIYDPKCRAIAAVHAGWRGMVAGIVPAALQKMREHFGTNPADCLVYVGTCIDEDTFEVGAEVAVHFADTRKRFNQKAGKYFVDLKRAIADQLTKAGVQEQHIGLSPYATAQNLEDYFSHRAENGATGRMLAVIGMK